jgi:large subunit ribosomal protein LP0
MSDAGKKRKQRKNDFCGRFLTLLKTYHDVMVITIDNVGSLQMQKVRMAIRGRAVVVVGKNTVMRKVIKDYVDSNKANKEIAGLMTLYNALVGNVGLVFCQGPLAELRNVIMQFKVPAAAKSGSTAPTDVFVPPGPTGLDPGQTSFFQALNIATKIVKGAIEILNNVHLIKKSDRVTSSHVALLAKLDIKPFFYGIIVQKIYENGSLYDAAALDITPADVVAKFQNSIRRITALSLKLGIPSALTIPHSIGGAFRKLMAVALATGNTNFKQAEAMLKAAEAAKTAVAAAPAAAAASTAKAAAPAAAAAAKEEEPEEEMVGAGGLFGDD